MGITELVELVRAGLDEDERVALNAGGRTRRRWAADVSGHDPHGNPSCPAVVRHQVGGRLRKAVVHSPEEQSRAAVEHIARHDPARELAEVAAKRQLLDSVLAWPHGSFRVDGQRFPCDNETDPTTCDCGRDERVYAVLQLLAQPYRESP